MSQQFNEALKKFILGTQEAAIPVSLGITTYSNGEIEKAPGVYFPCLVLEHVRENLHDGDSVLYGRLNGDKKYVVIGKV